MEIIIHRVNSVKDLKKINNKYGTEIDIRARGNNLILNHEPHLDGEFLVDYLKEYKHGTLILNIKEAGIEKEVIDLLNKYNTKNYFLLDVEFPFIYKSYNTSFRSLALRISYFEPIKFVKNFDSFFDWLWLDSYEFCKFEKNEIKILNLSKICFVCPSRWNKSYQIDEYKAYFNENKIKINAVMTSIENAHEWEN